MKFITVIGMGYVGLPSAIEASKLGMSVTGVDIDSTKVSTLNIGKSYIDDISDEAVQNAINSENLKIVDNINKVKKSDLFLICVPTPLNSDRKPDLRFLISAIEEVGAILKNGNLVIVESTVAPGTIRNIVLPLLESKSGIDRQDFQLAYSPERIDPGNGNWTISNTPKLVSGMDSKSLQSAVNFYSNYVEEVVPCTNFEIAEMSKLLENSFRLINISFINELAILCNRLKIDLTEVIAAAATKPYGYMPFYPSIGVGGHCIPVDPIYLADSYKSIGLTSQFIELADRINLEVPKYFVDRAEKILKILIGKKILVIGVSYKPNVADIRETPVEALLLELSKKGAIVSWHDDLVKEWNGQKSNPLSDKYDLAILATPHNYLDLTKLGSVPILNTRSSI